MARVAIDEMSIFGKMTLWRRSKLIGAQEYSMR